jgi:hypothetical protein
MGCLFAPVQLYKNLLIKKIKLTQKWLKHSESFFFLTTKIISLQTPKKSVIIHYRHLVKGYGFRMKSWLAR